MQERNFAQQLSALKQILATDDGAEELRERLDNSELRSDELAAIIEQVLNKNIASPHSQLARVIEKPVSESIARSIKRDPSVYIDALFPIIGSVVRKYIAEALAAFVQNTSSVLEHSFSPRALKWRVQSFATGVPFRELVLRNTFAYYIDEVFLIERHSGLLLTHVGRGNHSAKDPDAVSALLTAITDFANDSFQGENIGTDALDAIEVGGANVWLVQSAGVIMAIVMHGKAPVALRGELQQILEEILIEHGELIRNFNGDKSQLAVVEPELSRCFELVQNRHRAMRRNRRAPLWWRLVKYALFAILCLYLIWYMCVRISQNQCRQYAIHILNNAPSVVIADSQWLARHWYDPRRDLHFKILLAPQDAAVVATVHQYVALKHGTISFESNYYQPIEHLENGANQ